MQQSTSSVSDIRSSEGSMSMSSESSSYIRWSSLPSSEFEIEHFLNEIFMISGLKSSHTSLTHVHTVVMLGFLLILASVAYHQDGPHAFSLAFS